MWSASGREEAAEHVCQCHTTRRIRRHTPPLPSAQLSPFTHTSPPSLPSERERSKQEEPNCLSPASRPSDPRPPTGKLAGGCVSSRLTSSPPPTRRPARVACARERAGPPASIFRYCRFAFLLHARLTASVFSISSAHGCIFSFLLRPVFCLLVGLLAPTKKRNSVGDLPPAPPRLDLNCFSLRPRSRCHLFRIFRCWRLYVTACCLAPDFALGFVLSPSLSDTVCLFVCLFVRICYFAEHIFSPSPRPNSCSIFAHPRKIQSRLCFVSVKARLDFPLQPSRFLPPSIGDPSVPAPPTRLL